jgi:hypothetical protein
MAYMTRVNEVIQDGSHAFFREIVTSIPVLPKRAEITMVAQGIVEPELDFDEKDAERKKEYFAECKSRKVTPYRKEIFRLEPKEDDENFFLSRTETGPSEATVEGIIRGHKPHQVVVEMPYAKSTFELFRGSGAGITLGNLVKKGYQIQRGHLWVDYEHSHGADHRWQGVRMDDVAGFAQLTLYGQEHTQLKPDETTAIVEWFKSLREPARVD